MLWQGDPAAAVTEAEAAIRAWESASGGYHGPPTIRVAAVGVSALADQAVRARAVGDADRAAAAVAAARSMAQIARERADWRRPSVALGVDGRGWLARAEAEWRRADGDNDPAAWRAVVATFGPGFVYETARARWRLAEALAEAGDRDAARREWLLAAQAAADLRAEPLQAALADLGTRARLASVVPGAGKALGEAARSGPGGPGSGGPLAGLTGRELEVLRLLAAGQSNREIAAELFISPKTASVHVSNILGKLGASSRTEAAAIAHRQGLDLPSAPARR
jgi:DNA-binding CsgD family transcriptional regulator